ncbi:MAG TPA: hypothetical protein VM912_16490 [Terriglobales bacterium]|nr:hypothetical protein [Terriglobales bacterium]
MEAYWKRKSVRRIGAVLLLGIVCGYATLLVAINRAMHEPPEQFGKFMSRMPVAVFLIAPFETMWTRARAGNLKVGDTAPDFTLSTLDKTAHVSLSSLRSDKPLVLVFGSYT